jgi:3-phosphoshikimate 1-carboxyvinyltransferase
MIVTITPTHIVGNITPPGSKSVLHRALVLALLTKGRTELTKVSLSDDILATIEMIQAYGATVEVRAEERLIVVESSGTLVVPTAPIDCVESGTTYRFAVALAMTLSEEVVITGAKGLLARPIDGYESLVNNHQIKMELSATQLTVQGPLNPKNNWVVDGSKSSQFVSGLLLAALRYETPITIQVLGRLSSRAYVDITTQVMSQFGAVVTYDDPLFHVEKGLLSAREFEIEIDYSQAAVWSLAKVFFPGITMDHPMSLSTQPDQFMEEFLAQNSTKQGFEVDVDATPDIAPLIMLYATQCQGTSIIRGTSRLRFKESDRVASTLTTLQAFGASSIIRDDEVVIKGPVQLVATTVDAYQDHRIVMMATIAALLAKGTTTIQGAQAITKSYPDFFKDLLQVGGRYEISN